MALSDFSRPSRHEVAQRICCVIAAHAVLVVVHLQHIFRAVWVVLQCWQTFQQPAASAE